MAQEDIHIAVKLLKDYIENNNLRMIPKRFSILEYIYSYEEVHFSIDSLYEYIQKQGCKISRATLYNTTDLLLEANLVKKLQFLQGVAVYEKAVNKKNHHHYVCTKCGRIQDLRDDGTISTAIQTRRIAKFKQTGFSLCIYGICSACAKSTPVP